MNWVITYFHLLITRSLSKVSREFSSLSLPGSHCSCVAKFPPLCNLPKRAENTVFLQNSDHRPLPWYTFGLKQQLHTGDQIFKSAQYLKVSLWCLWPDFHRSSAINVHPECELFQNTGFHVWLLSYFWKPGWLHKIHSLALSCFPT